MLTLMEGFDHEDTTALTTKGWNAQLANIGVEAIGTGRITGNALGLRGGVGGSTSLVYKPLPASQAQVVFGFAFYIPARPGLLTRIVALGTGGGIAIDTAGRVCLVNSSYGLVATGSALAVPGWHYIEGKLIPGGASGHGWTQVNGAPDIVSAVGNFGSGDIVTFYCTYDADPWVTNFVYWDDIYVCDTTGSLNNDFLGDSHIETIYPNGDGAHSDWVPNSGSTHWTQVDEHPPDGDTTYNGSGVVNAIDTYTMQDLTVIAGGIFGVQPSLHIKKADAAFRQAKPVVRRGGTDYLGAVETLNTSYVARAQIFETDPSTSAPWTVAGVNAAEFGAKVTA